MASFRSHARPRIPSSSRRSDASSTSASRAPNEAVPHVRRATPSERRNDVLHSVALPARDHAVAGRAARIVRARAPKGARRMVAEPADGAASGQTMARVEAATIVVPVARAAPRVRTAARAIAADEVRRTKCRSARRRAVERSCTSRPRSAPSPRRNRRMRRDCAVGERVQACALRYRHHCGTHRQPDAMPRCASISTTRKSAARRSSSRRQNSNAGGNR